MKNNNKENQENGEKILVRSNDNKDLKNEEERTLEHIPQNVENALNEDDQIKASHYLKEDCLEGYITNSDEIAQLKRKQQIDILKNTLLGDFDENGNYVLSPEIINELKNVKKEVIEQYKTYLFLHTVYPIKGFGNISFLVSVAKQSNGDLKARLVLLEKVEKINGYIVNTISASVNEFIASPSANYYDDMKKAFNIVEVDHKDIENEEDLKYCMLRKIELSNLWKSVNKQINKIEKEVFENKIKALEEMKNNQFAKNLLNKFNQERSKIESSFIQDNSQKYIALNSLLDSCFDMLKGENLAQEIIVATTFINAGKIAVDLQNILLDENTNFNIQNNTANFEHITDNIKEDKHSYERNYKENQNNFTKQNENKTKEQENNGVLPGDQMGRDTTEFDIPNISQKEHKVEQNKNNSQTKTKIGGFSGFDDILDDELNENKTHNKNEEKEQSKTL